MSSPKMELETAELERIRSFLALPNGTKRALYEWRASDEDRPLGSLLIIHGLGEHGGRYASEAQFFAERGLHVYCMDVMGHGYSDGARGVFHPTMRCLMMLKWPSKPSASDRGIDL